MAILETHFFNQLLTFNFTRETAAIIFSVYGLLTMIGSALSGILCSRFSMKNLLGSIYAVRIVLALTVIIMPKSILFIVPFAIVLGLTSDSTVSPTAGLVLQIFGIAKLPTLFGLAFLTHQADCFASAWLGGLFVETTGNYESLWICDGILSTIAAVVSYLVRKKRAAIISQNYKRIFLTPAIFSSFLKAGYSRKCLSNMYTSLGSALLPLTVMENA